MKKFLPVLLIVILLILALGGYVGYKLYKKAKLAAMQHPVMMGQEHSGMFASIQDALSKQLTLQCQFTSDQGVATTAYIKMGAVRVDANTGKPDATSFIMKDKKVYFWQVASKTGTVMTIPDITITPVPTSTVQPTGESENQGANMLAMLEKFKDSCKTGAVADSLFVPPTDVTFTDMSRMMPSGIPTGMPTGMMQHYVVPTIPQY